MEKSSDGCLCKVCDLKGCKGCPRAKAEEGVMRLKKIKQSVSVDKIQKIMYKTEDDYELGETNSLHIAIAKAISKSIL